MIADAQLFNCFLTCLSELLPPQLTEHPDAAALKLVHEKLIVKIFHARTGCIVRRAQQSLAKKPTVHLRQGLKAVAAARSKPSITTPC